VVDTNCGLILLWEIASTVGCDWRGLIKMLVLSMWAS
jgi:hypothetical protein